MDQILQLLMAAAGGGALLKLVEKIFDRLTSRGQEVRDEVRVELGRLTKRTEDLEQKVVRLEKEIEDQKGKVDLWRGKYYDLMAEHRTLVVTENEKGRELERARKLLMRIRGSVSCNYATTCPYAEDIIPTPTPAEKKEDPDGPTTVG